MEPVKATTVRFIRLGRQNAWAKDAFARGVIPYGDEEDRHELAGIGNWEALATNYRATKPRTKSVVSDLVRAIKDFYTLGPDCLWVTFAEGKLWWTFADPEVVSEPGDGRITGNCYRRTINGWSDKNIKGEPLRTTDLSTRLTKVASYQKTICNVSEREYLLRKLNAETEPSLAKAAEAKALLVSAALDLITQLHQSDFEVMADLIFTRGGWRRTSVLGKTQADIDLALEQPTTGERAFVQVKSSASQAVLDDYIDRFESDGTYDRFYFICHSPKGKLDAGGKRNMHIWAGEALARTTIEAGLIDWLMKRCS